MGVVLFAPGEELYHVQNTGKFFAFSREEAWLW